VALSWVLIGGWNWKKVIIPLSEYTGWGTQTVIQLTLGGPWLVTFHGENCQVLNISAPTGNVNSMESGSHCDGWECLGWGVV